MTTEPAVRNPFADFSRSRVFPLGLGCAGSESARFHESLFLTVGCEKLSEASVSTVIVPFLGRNIPPRELRKGSRNLITARGIPSAGNTRIRKMISPQLTYDSSSPLESYTTCKSVCRIAFVCVNQDASGFAVPRDVEPNVLSDIPYFEVVIAADVVRIQYNGVAFNKDVRDGGYCFL